MEQLLDVDIIGDCIIVDDKIYEKIADKNKNQDQQTLEKIKENNSQIRIIGKK